MTAAVPRLVMIVRQVGIGAAARPGTPHGVLMPVGQQAPAVSAAGGRNASRDRRQVATPAAARALARVERAALDHGTPASEAGAPVQVEPAIGARATDVRAATGVTTAPAVTAPTADPDPPAVGGAAEVVRLVGTTEPGPVRGRAARSGAGRGRATRGRTAMPALRRKTGNVGPPGTTDPVTGRALGTRPGGRTTGGRERRRATAASTADPGGTAT